MNEQTIIEQMQQCKSWEDKYRLIIKLGKALPAISEQNKAQAIEVKGCESKVILAWQCEDQRYQFQADSDARIVKGLLAIVLAAACNKSKEEIKAFDFEIYFEKLTLLHHLSQSRSNGVNAIVKAIQNMI